ncbi:glycosyltransferase family 2 protein [Martelella sp. FLE1502]
MPQVSVIMPVYNGEAFLFESISSILHQTFYDFELIIIDDASIDRSGEMIARFSDPRLTYRRLARNSGSAVATNAGYRLAQGAYIAHIDQDDIALADRLQKQVGYLEAHGDITVLGGMMEVFGHASTKAVVPLQDGQIKMQLLAGISHIYNPTVMYRRAFVEDAGLRFDPKLKGAADWGLWVEMMMQGGRFANLDAVLTRYRVHQGQQSVGGGHAHAAIAGRRARIIALFYPQLTAEECRALSPLLNWASPPRLSAQQLRRGLAILERAFAWKKASPAGEDRQMLDRYMLACHQRASAALGAR